MANITVEVIQIGKAPKNLSLPEGTSIRGLLEEMQLDSDGLTFTVTDRSGAVAVRQTSYELRNFDQVNIGANNKGA